ncbi:gas vesicle protein GvpH [Natrinema salaciae]|uniref:Molecular chaperone IbpA, HSP20 family n=1 Tax=Natrinema salaciae TaxID=1186196 RepID=A0A1H9RA18_9EURY|nr:gas vesicle protein GvpH [Natrinema salaciae]SER69508.1 Molecular chaperone IbpA, HSP20 family [Natrinema salaciae]
MSNDDETERETSESPNSSSDSHETGPSVGGALETALQAGLRSLSDGLANLLEEAKSDRAAPRARPSTGREGEDPRPDDVKRERKTRTNGSTAEACLIDTRVTDDEFVVVADMLGASIDDITVAIDPRTNELVIRKSARVVGRVELPRDSPDITKAWFKNGILEVYLKADDSEPLEESRA